MTSLAPPALSSTPARPTTLVMVGPHAAGKTTLGRALARALGWRFHEELGARLAARPGDGDGPGPGADAASRPARFDERVFLAERRRDRAWARRRGGARVVETWHLGNLAYARHRNPALGAALRARVERLLQTSPGVLVLPVTASDEALTARFHEPGDPATLLPLFRAVAQDAVALARHWGLPVLPTLDTTARSPVACVTEALRHLSTLGLLTRPTSRPRRALPGSPARSTQSAASPRRDSGTGRPAPKRA